MLRGILRTSFCILIAYPTLSGAASYIPEKEREIVEKLADYASVYLEAYLFVPDKNGDLLYEAGSSHLVYGSDDIPNTYFALGPNFKIFPKTTYPGIGSSMDRAKRPPREQARAELEALIGAKLNEGLDKWDVGLDAIELYLKKYPKDSLTVELPGKMKMGGYVNMPNGILTTYLNTYSYEHYGNRYGFHLKHKWPRVTLLRNHEAERERILEFRQLEALFSKEYPNSKVKRAMGSEPYFKARSFLRRK